MIEPHVGAADFTRLRHIGSFPTSRNKPCFATPQNGVNGAKKELTVRSCDVKEILLKQWFAEEAQRLRIDARAVAARMYKLGKYPDMPKRYVNRRVVYVPADYHPMRPEHPRPGEIRLKAFCNQEMERLNLPTPKAAYTRLSRGWYKNRLKIRRVNRTVVFVKWMP